MHGGPKHLFVSRDTFVVIHTACWHHPYFPRSLSGVDSTRSTPEYTWGWSRDQPHLRGAACSCWRTVTNGPELPCTRKGTNLRLPLIVWNAVIKQWLACTRTFVLSTNLNLTCIYASNCITMSCEICYFLSCMSFKVEVLTLSCKTGDYPMSSLINSCKSPLFVHCSPTPPPPPFLKNLLLPRGHQAEGLGAPQTIIASLSCHADHLYTRAGTRDKLLRNW